MGEQPSTGLRLLLEVFQQVFILAISFLQALYVLYLRKQRKNATQTTFQLLQQSFYFDLLKTCPTSYLYFICERLKKFHPKQIFPWKRPSLMRCRSSDVSAEEFCQFWQKKKKRVGDRTKTKLPGKHAMLQVNGLKCHLVNCHKAREVNQSTRVNGAMVIYTEDLALDFNRTSLASCFSAYPSSSLFNKLSVILGLSFNNSPFSLRDPSSLSGDNGMGFSARSPHRNIVDRLNSAQLATGFLHIPRASSWTLISIFSLVFP